MASAMGQPPATGHALGVNLIVLYGLAMVAAPRTP
jgi:hypothetical protein